MKTSLLSFSSAAFVAIAATSFAGSPSRAEIDYPWCSISSTGQSGIPVCRYTTLEQCRASVTNGYCDRNAVIVWREQQMQEKKKRGAR